MRNTFNLHEIAVDVNAVRTVDTVGDRIMAQRRGRFCVLGCVGIQNFQNGGAEVLFIERGVVLLKSVL